LKSKLINSIKEHLLIVSVASAALVALAVSATVTAVMISAMNTKDFPEKEEIPSSDVEISCVQPDLLPEFRGIELPAFVKPPLSAEKGEEYIAEYYDGVTDDQVSEYISLLEVELGVDFTDSEYPRVASADGAKIIIHYNSTESKMSVTVVAVK